MTTQCPICRSPVEVDDAKLGADGVKAQCGLCDEVFLVRPPGGGGAGSAAAGGSGKTSSTRTPSGAASASRRLLEEDVEGAAPRVLVAHDSHVFGETVRSLLEEEGFDVEVVHDGDAASQVILDRPPLVAILEAGLPKKFGFQLCADMRALPDPPPVKFLLVASIYDRKRFAKQPSLATAPDDFLEPRNLELELLPKVRRLLRGRTDATASRPAVSGATAARRIADSAAPDPDAPHGTPAETDSGRRAPDPPSVSRPTVGEDDFKELFEDSAFQNTGSTGSDEPADSAAVRAGDVDVDELLADEPGSAPGLDTKRELPDDDDVLRDVLEDSEPPSVSGSAPSSPGSGEHDDDELLRTLMQMASSEGVEPSKPQLEDDEVLPEDGEPVPKSAEPDEEALLGGILEDDAGGHVEEPTGRAPDDGPMELPSAGSVAGSEPEIWKADAADAERASNTDDDELEKLLGGSSEDRPPAPSDDIVRVSEFELGGDAPAPPPSAGPEPEDDDVLKAALEADGGFAELGGAAGVLPASGSAGTPTVLKGPGGTQAPTKVTGDLDAGPGADDAVPLAADGAGNSFSSTESLDGAPAEEPRTAARADDDEKSLAAARVPSEMDDELDRLLGGGSGSDDFAAAGVGSMDGDAGPGDTGASGPSAVAGGDSLAQEHEKAHRLAKLIVGDILLYNAERIPDAVKSGTFFEVMKGDIKDGRDFYDEKVPEDVRRERDHIQEVLEEVLENKRKELGLA